MSITATRPSVTGTTSPAPVQPRKGPRAALRDLVVMTWRNVLHIRREPLQLSDVTIQPVLFTILFVYVFRVRSADQRWQLRRLRNRRSDVAEPHDFGNGYGRRTSQ